MRRYRLLLVSILILFAIALGFVDANALQQETDIENLFRAAELGDAGSQSELALNYALGRGVSKNTEEAVKWYQKAADQGDITAWLALGEMYSSGLDVRQDCVLAYMWFDLAAGISNGHGRTIAQKDREKLAKKMAPQQIAEAQRLVQEWKFAHMQSPTTKSSPKQEVAIDGVTAPIPLFQPLPSLTDDARKAGVKGEVILQCIVRVRGTVDSCKIITKLGYGLDEAAINTVTNKWRFKPATLRGRSGDAKIMISISANQFH
jgi:TonB family protein